MAPMAPISADVCFVLVRVRNPLNIGAAARAMANFGLADLVAVEPFGPAWREARSAVGAEDLLRRSRELELAEALADRHLVLGATSAKRRGLQQPMVALPGLGDFLRERLPDGGRVAVLFGSEKNGLRNEELQHCHALLNIPTSSEVPSMNLGQAVAVTAYELSRRGLEDGIREPGYAAPVGRQVEALVALADRALERADYMQHMPASTRSEKLRRMLLRWRMTRGDATLLAAYLRRVVRAGVGR